MFIFHGKHGPLTDVVPFLTFQQTVKQNQIEYDLPLKILSYDELYGWTMDKIVAQVGKKNNCECREPEALFILFPL